MDGEITLSDSIMHLAQLNAAQPLYPLDDPRMADFMDNLDRINAIAERSPGFVWRLTGDGNDATDLRHGDDPDSIYNLSVWETAKDLEHFVWNTVHARFYTRKTEWFSAPTTHHFVMWPVAEGHRPTLDEAVGKLEQLNRFGSSPDAFGWEGLPQPGRLMERRCG